MKVLYWLKLLIKAFLIAILIVAVGTYVFFIPRIFGYTCGQMILMPFPPDESYEYKSLRGVEKQDVFIGTGDSAKLHGWLYKLPDSKYVALISHGNAGHIGGRLLLADALLDSGISVLLYDYRGYGRSTGSSKLQTLVPDADAAFTYLVREQNYQPAQIILVGESIGCAVTSDLLKLHPDVAGIVLVSPFTSLLRLARQKIPYFYVYPDFLDFDPAFNNMEMVQAAHPPLLITHGDRDTLVPFSESEKLFAAAIEPKKFMPLKNGGHNNYIQDHEFFKKGVLDYLKSVDAAVAKKSVSGAH